MAILAMNITGRMPVPRRVQGPAALAPGRTLFGPTPSAKILAKKTRIYGMHYRASRKSSVGSGERFTGGSRLATFASLLIWLTTFQDPIQFTAPLLPCL